MTTYTYLPVSQATIDDIKSRLQMASPTIYQMTVRNDTRGEIILFPGSEIALINERSAAFSATGHKLLHSGLPAPVKNTLSQGEEQR